MKTHKVGSITFGSILIILGLVLILQAFVPSLNYETILNFWPASLIVLGLEVLIANFRSEKVQFIYDGWSIFFLFSALGFTMCMGILTEIMKHLPQYI